MNALYDWFLATLISLGASPFDLFLVLALVGSYFQNKWLKDKYQILNTGLSTHAFIILIKLGIKTVKHHRNGDIELVNAIDYIEDE